MHNFLNKKTFYVLLIALCLASCSKQSAELRDVQDLKERLVAAETKIALHETKLNEFGEKNQGNWVLWQSSEWFDSQRLNNFGWPKMLSAHSTKEECSTKAREYSFEKNNSVLLNGDPYKITDGVYVLIYTCMPPNVDMRAIPKNR